MTPEIAKLKLMSRAITTNRPSIFVVVLKAEHGSVGDEDHGQNKAEVREVARHGPTQFDGWALDYGGI